MTMKRKLLLVLLFVVSLAIIAAPLISILILAGVDPQVLGDLLSAYRNQTPMKWFLVVVLLLVGMAAPFGIVFFVIPTVNTTCPECGIKESEVLKARRHFVRKSPMGPWVCSFCAASGVEIPGGG